MFTSSLYWLPGFMFIKKLLKACVLISLQRKVLSAVPVNSGESSFYSRLLRVSQFLVRSQTMEVHLSGDNWERISRTVQYIVRNSEISFSYSKELNWDMAKTGCNLSILFQIIFIFLLRFVQKIISLTNRARRPKGNGSLMSITVFTKAFQCTMAYPPTPTLYFLKDCF